MDIPSREIQYVVGSGMIEDEGVIIAVVIASKKFPNAVEVSTNGVKHIILF